MTPDSAHDRLRSLVAMTAPLILCDEAEPYRHIGAVLADASLQAGVRYKTVVYPRVLRITRDYPAAATTAGLLGVLDVVSVAALLDWNHPDKPQRFLDLLSLCVTHGIDDTDGLHLWLGDEDAVEELKLIKGIGPKTIDYLRLLIGHTTIPIDRHVLRFIAIAGVGPFPYLTAQRMLLDACDDLGVNVRAFERGLWRSLSLGPPRILARTRSGAITPGDAVDAALVWAD